MSKVLFYILFFVTFVYSFDTKDLEKEDINYLTQTEKYILKNLKSIKKLQTENSILKQKVLKQSNEIINIKKELQQYKLILQKERLKINTIVSRVDGMESIFPSFDKTSTNIISLKKDFYDFNSSVLKENNILKEKIVTLKNDISTLEKSLIDSNKIIKDNYTTMTSIIEKIAKEIDTLKKENISLKEKLNKKSNDFRKKSKYIIFNLAKVAYDKKEYNKSYEMFDYLLKEEYKPATSSFYIGEIYYYKQGDYKTALKFYKKSIEYYPKPASFTDKLLYHTGYSLEKIGKKNSAIRSYKKLIKEYPKSGLVDYAKKRLLQLTLNSQ
jgi:TolA-binding protein